MSCGVRRAVLALAACCAAGAGLAEEPAGGAVLGQTILNPEPGFAGQPPLVRVHDGLAELAPGAGATMQPAGCAGPDGWSVVVIRGDQEPETVRGHVVTIIPAEC